MAAQVPGNPSQREFARDAASKWYFSREQIEFHTPSRNDGIDSKWDSHLRRLYCSFLQELGMQLNVHQLTIATAMMFCHRFYMRQSHAKNDWKTIATVCMFLACKAEETPRYLDQLIVVASKLINRRDPSTSLTMRDLIMIGERLLLATLAFDLRIEHPHKPLMAVLKRMEISHKGLVKMAWNFVNDWLHTSLCLQHKPHYIAAGSIFLAAKVLNVKLPRVERKVWWMQLDVIPNQLEDVIQQMHGYLAQKWKQVSTKDQRRIDLEPVMREGNSGSAHSCTLSGSITVQDTEILASMDSREPAKSSMSKCSNREQDFDSVHGTSKRASGCQSRNCESANSGVDDYDGKPR